MKWFLIALEFALLACIGSNSYAACQNIPKERLQTASAIIASFGYEFLASETISGGIQMFVKGLDATNPQWNPSNPKWPKMEALVRRDLEQLLKGINERFVGRALAQMECQYASGMSDDDAESMLRYLRSMIGERHLAFGRELQQAMSNTVMKMMAGSRAGGDRATKGATQRRLDLLQASFPYAAIKEFAILSERHSGDVSASSFDVLPMIYADITSNSGNSIDLIGERYADDIHNFGSTVRSELVKKHFAAWYEMSQSAASKESAATALREFVEAVKILDTNWKSQFKSL